MFNEMDKLISTFNSNADTFIAKRKKAQKAGKVAK